MIKISVIHADKPIMGDPLDKGRQERFTTGINEWFKEWAAMKSLTLTILYQENWGFVEHTHS